MLKLAILYGLVGAATPAANLDGYVKVMNDAQSLKATYSVTRIGGTGVEYVVELSKPNFIKLDSPSQLVVADGANITTYDKSAKTYFKKPQTKEDLAELFNSDEMTLWSPFFTGKGFKDLATTSGGTKTRKGMSLSVVNGEFKSGKKANFFLDDKNVARQLEFVYPDGEKARILVDTKEVALSGDAMTADQFAFKAPEGARELTKEEMLSDKWYTDLDEAKKVASSSKRILMIDFYADW